MSNKMALNHHRGESAFLVLGAIAISFFWFMDQKALAAFMAGIFGFVLIIRNPVWGLGLLIGLDALVNLLPQAGAVGSIAPVLGVAILFSYGLRQQKLRHPIVSMGLLFAFFLLWFLVSNLIGQYAFNIPSDRNWAITYIQLVLLVWLVVQLVKSEKDIELVMKITFAAFLINSLFAFGRLNFLIGMSEDEFSRLSGLTGNANEFAIYASIGLLFTLYFLRKSTGLSRLAFLFSFAIFLASILFSGSRGSLLFVVAAAVYFFFRSLGNKNKQLGYFIWMGIIGISVWPFLPDVMQNRFAAIPNAIFEGDDTVSLRYQLWDVAIKLWSTSKLFGIGSGGFIYLNKTFQLLGPGLHSYIAPHNMFISILVENGLFGFIPFAIIFVITAINYFRIEKNMLANANIMDLVWVWQSVFLFIFLAGLKASFQYYRVVWLPIAIGLALYLFTQRHVSALKPDGERNDYKMKSLAHKKW